MAEVFLDCGHPAIVTHDRGERLVFCAVPRCGASNVITAHPVSDVIYEVRRGPGAAAASELEEVPS